MLTLYFAPGSSSFAAHIALHEVGVPLERRRVSLGKKEQHDPAFLALNPAAKVPTLVIDGRVLTEVAGILFYLARRFPEANLLPINDPEAEAQVVSWMSFLASSVHPARRNGIEAAKAAWAITERKLAGRTFAVGERYSIADIHLFRLYWRLNESLNAVAVLYPGLRAHYDRVLARPAVRKTIDVETAMGYELPA
jgi:glutathione S-transferase